MSKISLVILKISNFSWSGSILINLQPRSCSAAFIFLFGSQYFCCCVHFHQFLLRAYSHENISKSYDLKHYCCVCMLSSSNQLITFVITDFSFVKMTSHCLNLISFLNLWADVALQSILTLVANFSSIKILLDCFLVCILVHIYVFYGLNDVLFNFLQIFMI